MRETYTRAPLDLKMPCFRKIYGLHCCEGCYEMVFKPFQSMGSQTILSYEVNTTGQVIFKYDTLLQLVDIPEY